MKKLFLIDFKRLFQNKASVIFTVAVPVFLVVLISLLLAPYFFEDTIVDEYYIAIYNEDGHPLTSELLDTILKSQELDKLIDAVFVDSDEAGFEELEKGATAYIHLPADMQETISKDEPVVITYAGNPDMPIEDAVLTAAMNAASDLVNFTQNASIVLYENLEPINIEAADKLYSDIARKYFYEVMNRKGVYTRQSDDVSPFGAALPIEYYASAVLVLFIALGGMPLAKTISDDRQNGIVHRQLLSGNPPLRILLSKWLSGSLFLLIQFFVLTACIMIITKSISYYAGSFLSLLGCGILLCLFASALHVASGLFFRNSEIASFVAVVALAALGGLFVPSVFMPDFLGAVSGYTPLSSAHMLAVSGMFRVEAGGLALGSGILAFCTAALLGVSMRRMTRRAV